jgi:hypothetical protein
MFIILCKLIDSLAKHPNWPKGAAVPPSPSESKFVLERKKRELGLGRSRGRELDPPTPPLRGRERNLWGIWSILTFVGSHTSCCSILLSIHLVVAHGFFLTRGFHVNPRLHSYLEFSSPYCLISHWITFYFGWHEVET